MKWFCKEKVEKEVYYLFDPQMDITIYELALCLAMINGISINAIEKKIADNPGLGRHIKRVEK